MTEAQQIWLGIGIAIGLGLVALIVSFVALTNSNERDVGDVGR